jgi:hypothetical protein
MSTIKALGNQLNTLRTMAGKKPLSDPTKLGLKKVQDAIQEMNNLIASQRPEATTANDPVEGMMPSEPEASVSEVTEAMAEALPPHRTVGLSPDEAAKQHDEVQAKATQAPTEAQQPEASETGLPHYDVAEKLDEAALIQADKPETIRSISERLLQHVHYVDDADKRTVGVMYTSIIALVRKKFPKAQTSIECLRWYAVHMRAEGRRLPQKRPRPSTRT